MSMTVEEAIKQAIRCAVGGCSEDCPYCDSDNVCHASEGFAENLEKALSEFRELKEKATAKKPIVEVYAKSLYERKTYRCPSCNHKLISKIDGGWCGGTLSKNCEECGTALDWSEEKE